MVTPYGAMSLALYPGASKDTAVAQLGSAGRGRQTCSSLVCRTCCNSLRSVEGHIMYPVSCTDYLLEVGNAVYEKYCSLLRKVRCQFVRHP